MFEFLKKRPFSRWKFVQRILDRTGDSRRRRLSADTDSGSEDAAPVDGSRDVRPRDADSNSLDCSERVAAAHCGGEAGDRVRERGTPPSADPAVARDEEADKEADKEAIRAVIQQASATVSKARLTAQVDIPFHARGHYSIGCDVNAGSSTVAAAAAADGAAGPARPTTPPAAAPAPRRGGSWHSSLRETKSKGALQMSKLRISFRKKPSTGQADYNVLPDENPNFDSAAAPAAAAAAAGTDEAARHPAGRRANELHGADSAAADQSPEAALTDSGDGRPRSQQAVADAVRRSFRKTTKYLRYGTQSMTLTKPTTSLNWASSSTTKQTLI